MSRVMEGMARIGIGAACVVGGWAAGVGIGLAIGTVADQLLGNPGISHAAMATSVGGLAGVLVGIAVGLRLAPRVASPWTVRIGVLTVLGLALIGLFGAIPMARGFCLLPSATEFDARSWRADDGEWPCGDRAGMADEIIAEVLRPGMRKAEIVQLLGSPLDEPAIAMEPENLVWKVSCQIDCEWLVVRIDDAGTLVSAHLRSD